MSRIDEAQHRLNQAIARLEQARSAQIGRIAELKEARSAGPDPAEMNALVQALDEAQRENAALVAEREAMADRVDTIVGRLKSVAGLDAELDTAEQKAGNA